MCESAMNNWCLATGQGDEHCEYDTVKACWQCQRVTVIEVMKEIATLNPHVALVEDDACGGGGNAIITVGTCSIEIDENDPHHVVVGDLDLSGNQLTMLPESFGHLTVGGSLSLSSNWLTTLPESFGSLTVGWDLDLRGNRLTMLPESFDKLTIGRHLYLHNNRLTTLPESFGSLLKVGGSMSLSGNQLTRLPESFGTLKVRGGAVLAQQSADDPARELWHPQSGWVPVVVR